MRQKPPFNEDLQLRDAEHYLYAYTDILHRRWRKSWSVTVCGLSLGYSGVKAILGPARGLLSAEETGKPTPPSWEEVVWGCQGASDARKGKLPVRSPSKSKQARP